MKFYHRKIYIEKQNAMLHKLRPKCAKLYKVKPSYPLAFLSVMYAIFHSMGTFHQKKVLNFRSVTQALFLVVLLSTSLFPPKSRQIDQKTCHQQHRSQSFSYSMMGAKVVLNFIQDQSLQFVSCSVKLFKHHWCESISGCCGCHEGNVGHGGLETKNLN